MWDEIEESLMRAQGESNVKLGESRILTLSTCVEIVSQGQTGCWGGCGVPDCSQGQGTSLGLVTELFLPEAGRQPLSVHGAVVFGVLIISFLSPDLCSDQAWLCSTVLEMKLLIPIRLQTDMESREEAGEAQAALACAQALLFECRCTKPRSFSFSKIWSINE